MTRSFAKSIVLTALVAVASSSQAISFFSTGVGLAGGATDLNWTVSGPATSGVQQAVALNFLGNPFPYSAYAPNDANSQWVSFAADGGNSLPAASTGGDYLYTTTVDFSGSTGTLSGFVWSDNSILDVMVGATSYGTAPLATTYADNSVSWFQTGTAFTLTGFSGVQTVTFKVKNGFAGYTGNNDPTAFRAQLNMQAVPEPFTVGLGLAAVGTFVRRRMAKKSA